MSGGIVKVFSIKDGGHHYYIQEMPGYWDFGRDYAVMKDRKRLYYGRFKSRQQAIIWLLKLLVQNYEMQLQMDL